MEKRLSSIQKVSPATAGLNVPKPTLRFWEKELDGIFVPFRTRGGQRRYTVENIAGIEEIKKLKRKGMSLPEIKRKLGKGQMSEAGSQTCPPSRATLDILYPFVDSFRRGGRGSGDERTYRVDLLAARVAEVVRAEVNSMALFTETQKIFLNINI